MMELNIRKIKEDDLEELLDLYQFLHPMDITIEPNDKIINIWKEILNNSLINIFLVEYKSKIVSSCVLNIIPNLTKSGRPYALIENVITHPDFRKHGYAKYLLNYVIDYSKRKNCYKIMLLSSKHRPEAHKLYEKVGLNKDKKYGFVLYLNNK